MSNGSSAHGHVTRINQRNDQTVQAFVEVIGFAPGQQVEVSVYLTQGDSYAFSNSLEFIPFPADPENPTYPELPIELPATKLNLSQNITVVTRVAEVWSTVLEQDTGTMAQYQARAVGSATNGPMAAWKAKYPLGKAPGYTAPPSPDNSSGAASPSD